jgi:heat shock protein 5
VGILLFFLLLICPLADIPAARAATVFEPGEPIIGINLGTTYLCVGAMKVDKAEILVNDQGTDVTKRAFRRFDWLATRKQDNAELCRLR